MQNIFLRSAITLLFVFLLTGNAFAWDEVGHKLTGYIAWQHMTLQAREKAFEILNSAPEDSDLNVIYDAYNSRSEAAKRLELFMFATTWADVVRNTDFEVRHKNYNHGNWHYVDIFWKQENGKAEILQDFPEPSGVAIQKLADMEQILRDPSYKTEEKAIALAWFLHIGGDIHNPLHNASRVTQTEPKGDQGGNLFVFRERTETIRGLNLHGFWDSIISSNNPRKNDACDADYLAPIARKIMKKYKYAKMRDRLKLGNYTAWNLEGFNLLGSEVYTETLKRNQMPPKKYNSRTLKISKEQIALAGYRLGETLNRIFDPKPTADVNSD